MVHIVGLDIGEYALRGCLLDANGLKLLKVKEVPLTSPENISAELKTLFADKDFAQAHIWANVNDRDCLARDMRVPFVNQDQIRQTIQFSAEEVISDDISHYLLDHRMIEIEESSTHLMIIAARRASLGKKLNQLQEAHVDPEGISFSGLALYYLASHIARQDNLEESFLILDVGATTADIIVGDKERLRFIRSILIKRAREGQGDSFDQERLKKLLVEVKRTLWSGGVDGHAEMIWVCGELSHFKGIEKMIADEFDVPSKIMPLDSCVDVSGVEQNQLGAYCQSVGLALMGAHPKDDYSINFRREEFIKQPFILKVRIPLICVLVLMIAILLWDGYMMIQKRQDLREQQRAHLNWEMQQFANFWGKENLPSDFEIQADPHWLLNEFNRHMGGVNENLTVYPDIAETIRHLSEHLKKFSDFKLKRLAVSRLYITLQGRFSSSDQLQNFEDDISKSDQEFFNRIEMRRGSSNVQEDGSIEFTCHIPLKKKVF